MSFVTTTWNPSDCSARLTLSGGDLVATPNTSGYSIVRSVHSVTAGKWLVDISRVSTNSMVGVASASESLNNYLGASSESIGLYDSFVYPGGAGFSDLASGLGRIGLAIDADARTVEIFNGRGTTGALSIPFSGAIFLAAGSGASSSGVVTLNAGLDAFYKKAGYRTGFGAVTTATLSGNVKDATGTNASRLVRAYREDTGVLAGEATSNGTTGNYSIATEYSGTHTLVFYPGLGESLPALVLRGVTPV